MAFVWKALGMFPPLPYIIENVRVGLLKTNITSIGVAEGNYCRASCDSTLKWLLEYENVKVY